MSNSYPNADSCGNSTDLDELAALATVDGLRAAIQDVEPIGKLKI